MVGRSRPEYSGSARGTANIVVSLVMLIAAGVSTAYAQTKSATAGWIQVGTGRGPAKVSVRAASASVATARATGDYVSLAKLKLFQIEEEPGSNGGVQSWGSGMTFVTRLRGCSPNPFDRTTTISYELGNASSVMFTLADVTGRAVRCLSAGPQRIGFHSTVWDGKDSRGRSLPAGVYFCRMQAGGTSATRRVTLIR